MQHVLFSEIPGIYASTNDDPNVMRYRVRMRDLVDPDVLRGAVELTVRRYPYFCVEIRCTENHEWICASNPRPVTVNHSRQGVDLNSPESNYHILAFSWYDNWIVMDLFHAMTDGKGSYELLRTLLYYYCSERYHTKLSGEGIRLVDDLISKEEWIDPLPHVPDRYKPVPSAVKPALRLRDALGNKADCRRTVYSIAIQESILMSYSRINDGRIAI